MKTTTYLKAIMLALCIMLAGCSNDDTAPQEPPITEISLNQTKLTLNVQNTEQLSVTTEINGKSIKWASDAPDVVSIDKKGNITALRGGVATISAQVENATATCIITVNPDVYVLGNRNGRGTVWKNSSIIKENLDRVLDFFVTEKGVYVLTQKKVFLNDELILDVSSNESENLRNLFVDGDDVYVGGDEQILNTDRSATYMAKLWKNGSVASILSEGAGITDINDIVVYNNDVYVLGTETDDNTFISKIVLWKNGVQTDIESPRDNSVARSLFVDKNHVYILGRTNNLGEEVFVNVWVNGVGKPINSGANASAIFVKDKDIYVAGAESLGGGKSKAVFWKNSAKNTLTDGTTAQRGQDIKVHGEDVYVVVTKYSNDTQKSFITLFKNEEETILGVGDKPSDAYLSKLFLY